MIGRTGTFFAAAAVALIVAAPADAGLFGPNPTTPVDYAPSSPLSARGTLAVGTFAYLPPPGDKLKPNEIKVDGFRTNILLDQDVGKFFSESLTKELRFVGIRIADGGAVLSGEIKAFTDNHMSMSTVDLMVHYVLKSADGALLYEAEKSTSQYYGTGYLDPIDAPLLANFEQLLRDPAFQKALDPSYVPPPPPPPIKPVQFALTTAPTTAFISGGAVRISTFDYLPSAAGKVGADQIRNTAIGSVKLDQPVGDFFAQGLLKQFRLAGLSVDSGAVTLSGTILEMFCDDLGYSADWTLVVKYVVKDASGTVVYEAEKVTKETTSKALAQVNRIIRHSAEALLLDVAFLKVIGAPPGPTNTAEVIIPYDSFSGMLSTEYAPRSALSVHGSVQVGPFAYLVAGPKTKTNEIPCTTLIASIYADKTIAQIFHDLTLNELRFVGIDVRGSDKVLTAEIQKYKVDNIAHPPEWVIAVRFVVKDKSGATLYDAVKSATPIGVQVAYWSNFSEIKVVLEMLLTDPAFVKAIN